MERPGSARGYPSGVAGVNLRAVFFDAGETIVHPSPSFAELFEATLARFGHEVDRDAISAGLRTIPQRFVEAAERGERWTTSPERSRRFWISVYEGFLERAGLPTGDGLQDALYGAFTDVANYALFDDAVPTFRELRKAGLRVGLVSNFEAWLDDLLERLGVREAFDVRVISGIEGVEKPDSAIFELALVRAGLRPGEVAYVGDVPALDIDPPLALGMRAVLIDRRERHPEHAGPRITNLGQLSGALGIAV